MRVRLDWSKLLGGGSGGEVKAAHCGAQPGQGQRVRADVALEVDTAHAGTGTRGYDLATLLMETTVGGDYAAPSLADQRRLERECVAIIGRLGFLVCVACRVMHLLVFGGVRWSAEVPQTVAKCHAFLDSLESTQAERP